MRKSELERAFAEYAAALLGRYEVGEVLYRLTDQAVAALDADGAGVSIADATGTLRFVTASDEAASRIEERQMETQDGPCHQAYATGEVMASADLVSDHRWPKYRPVAVEAGFRSVLGVPMPAQQQRIGALNVYRKRAGEWTEDERDRASLLANMAAGYVILARSLEESRTLSDQLQQALDSRIVVEQAKGIVAERHDLDLNDAFARLREESQRSNTPIHEICARVVAGELRF